MLFLQGSIIRVSLPQFRGVLQTLCNLNETSHFSTLLLYQPATKEPFSVLPPGCSSTVRDLIGEERGAIQVKKSWHDTDGELVYFLTKKWVKVFLVKWIGSCVQSMRHIYIKFSWLNYCTTHFSKLRVGLLLQATKLCAKKQMYYLYYYEKDKGKIGHHHPAWKTPVCL